MTAFIIGFALGFVVRQIGLAGIRRAVEYVVLKVRELRG